MSDLYWSLTHHGVIIDKTTNRREIIQIKYQDRGNKKQYRAQGKRAN